MMRARGEERDWFSGKASQEKGEKKNRKLLGNLEGRSKRATQQTGIR